MSVASKSIPQSFLKYDALYNPLVHGFAHNFPSPEEAVQRKAWRSTLSVTYLALMKPLGEECQKILADDTKTLVEESGNAANYIMTCDQDAMHDAFGMWDAALADLQIIPSTKAAIFVAMGKALSNPVLSIFMEWKKIKPEETIFCAQKNIAAHLDDEDKTVRSAARQLAKDIAKNKDYAPYVSTGFDPAVN